MQGACIPNGGWQVPSNGDSSRSRPTRASGSGKSNGCSACANGGDDGAQLDAETFVSTLASFQPMQPMQQQLVAYLKSKDADVADLKQNLKASDQRA